MPDRIDKLLEMADYFAAIGERDLAAELRRTANSLLDHILYNQQMAETAKKNRRKQCY